MLKLKDRDIAVRFHAMDEICPCFDFSRGLFPEKREAFLRDLSHLVLITNLYREILNYGKSAWCSPKQNESILTLRSLISL